jgi:hypothetical protein
LREPWQLAIVGRRKVLADGADLGRHEVEVVQQPLGRGRDELPAMNVVGQRGVGRPQDVGVVAQTGKEAFRSPGRGRNRESGRERPGPFFKALDAQQFVA